MDLQNKVIWITGGTRGIGLELVKLLAEDNCHVIASSSLDANISRATEIFNEKSNVKVVKCDIVSSESVNFLAENIIAKYGKIDALVNNSGISRSHSIMESTIEDFDKTICVNLRGVYHCIKAVLPNMIEHKNGVIMSTISVTAKKAFTGCGIYAASKAGLLALTNSLREEVRKDNIKITNIFPGATASKLWNKEILEKYGDDMMKPEDVACAMYYALLQSFKPGVMLEEIQLRPTGGDL